MSGGRVSHGVTRRSDVVLKDGVVECRLQKLPPRARDHGCLR